MKQKHLVILLVTVLLLGVIYAWTDENSGPGKSSKSDIRLLENVAGESVARVVLEQGADRFELVLKDGAWHIPSRGDYPADGAKIRALLLKLFDLNVSQKLPANPESLGKLGLDDAAVKAGKGKISLFAADGKPIVAVRLGEARKGKNDALPLGGMLNGQYVRRDDSSDVYAMATPITLAFGPTAWIDANVVNVLPSAVMSIASSRVKDGAEVPEFELVRTGASEKDTGFPTMTLKGGVPPDKMLQEVPVSQVRSALEDVRMSDVFSVDGPEVKDVVFDVLVKYGTTSGLVYSVRVGAKGDKFYARLSVAFDQALADQVKAAYDAQVKAAPSPSPSPSPAPSSAAPSSVGASPVASPVPTPSPSPQLSTAADAEKLNSQLAPWVYELVGFQAQQLRKSRADLIEPPAPPSPASVAQAPADPESNPLAKMVSGAPLAPPAAGAAPPAAGAAPSSAAGAPPVVVAPAPHPAAPAKNGSSAATKKPKG